MSIVRKSEIASTSSNALYSFVPYSFFPGSILGSARGSFDFCFKEVHDEQSETVLLLLNEKVYAEAGPRVKNEPCVLLESSTSDYIQSSTLHSPISSLLKCYQHLFNETRFQASREKYLSKLKIYNTRRHSGLPRLGKNLYRHKRLLQGSLFSCDTLGSQMHVNFPPKDEELLPIACRCILGLRPIIIMESLDSSSHGSSKEKRHYAEGKCLPPNTNVSLLNGSKSIYKLTKGDVDFLTRCILSIYV